MKGSRLYDVIIVGAGPGGSSAATFLARQGLSVLLLDKAQFPRDKVCGDGIMPQAIYWLDVLGCAEQVLSQTNACITSADLYVNGEHILTGRFPQDTLYPGFFTILERRKLDYTLVQHAVSHGAEFKPKHHIRKLFQLPHSIVVEAESENGTVTFKGKLLIGADGGNSLVSRALGNTPRDGTTAVSLRAYYQGVKADRSQFKIFFDDAFFPGYGWLFVDDSGKANIGVGVASYQNFPKRDLKKTLAQFVTSDLKETLRDATPIAQPAGWWQCFYKQKKVVDDRVMLIGDAANVADPMNGGGIAKAMESAYRASQVAVQALASGDCTRQSLSLYETLWQQQAELDWRTGELFLSFAKNPNLREMYLFFLKSLGKLSAKDQRFQDYCISFFTEFTSRSAALSPFILMDVIPIDPRAWLGILRDSDGSGFRDPIELALAATQNGLRMMGRMMASPFENLDWGLEVMNKTLDLVVQYANQELRTALGPRVGPFPM